MGRGRGQTNGQRIGASAEARTSQELLGIDMDSIELVEIEGANFYDDLDAQQRDRVEAIRQMAGLDDFDVSGPSMDITQSDWTPNAENGFPNGLMGAMGPRKVTSLPDEQLGYLMRRAREQGHSALSPVLFGVNDQDEALQQQEAKVAAQHAAAEQLGVKIPEANPHYVYTPQISRFGAMIRDWMDLGGRSYGLYGPHGAGKNALMDELGAALQMPVVEMDFGEGFTVQDAIGATGLGPVKTEDGTWMQGTVEEQGKLTRLSTLPVIAVCNEVESQRNQLESLHNLLGARFGDPDTRFVTINSPSGNDMNVYAHQDFQVALTWNPGREDARLKEATMDRMLSMEFGYGEEKEEADKVARVLNAHLGNYDKPIKDAEGNPIPKLDKNGNQEVTDEGQPVYETEEHIGILKREVTAEDVAPDVKFARICRAAYETNELEYQMGFRKILQISGIRLLQQMEDKPDATATALEAIKFAIPQNQPENDRSEILTRLATEAYFDILDDGSK